MYFAAAETRRSPRFRSTYARVSIGCSAETSAPAFVVELFEPISPRRHGCFSRAQFSPRIRCGWARVPARETCDHPDGGCLW